MKKEPTQVEMIESAIENLRDAMLREHMASIKEDDAKKEKIASHYEVTKAKETVRSLEIR